MQPDRALPAGELERALELAAADTMAADLADQRRADAAERRRNGRADRGPAGPRPRVKGSRKHCSTHAEFRADCYRCQTEGCF